MDSKKLSDMTLEELWQLFPIILIPHQSYWAQWYEQERAILITALPKQRITHIGSTAINDIWAKPIIDILVETDGELNELYDAIIGCGYNRMSHTNDRISFCKGYTPSGFAERVFHLHLRHNGDNDEIAFRDYLNAHSLVAKKYEQLKLNLWHSYEYDRDGYTSQKTDFVKKITNLAKTIK